MKRLVPSNPLRDHRIGQFIEARKAKLGEHVLDVGVSRTDMASNKRGE
jgi:hypothetical protein